MFTKNAKYTKSAMFKIVDMDILKLLEYMNDLKPFIVY